MKIIHTKVEGVLEIRQIPKIDARGSFLKIWEFESWLNAGLPVRWSEVYVTKSKKNVLRGMHFQVPPADHEKTVTVLDGEILDVALDIRRSSKTYGKYFSKILSADSPVVIFLPKGLAHGFLVLSTSATVLYHTTSAYSPEKDGGIRWDTFHFPWPQINPILSARDQSHPSFDCFQSPFL